MGINNGGLPAMPIIRETESVEVNGSTYTNVTNSFGGLTKREQFAMAAMQGMLANGTGYEGDAELLAQYAATNADALLAELERTK